MAVNDTFFLDVMGLFTERHKMRLGDAPVLVIMNDLVSNNEYYFKLNKWKVTYIAGNLVLKDFTKRTIKAIVEKLGVKFILIYGVSTKLVKGKDTSLYLNEQPTNASRQVIDYLQSQCQNTFNIVNDIWINSVYDDIIALYDNKNNAPKILVTYGGKRSIGSFLDLLQKLLCFSDSVET